VNITTSLASINHTMPSTSSATSPSGQSWHLLSTVRLARAVRRGEVTSSNLVEHYIKRIEALDGDEKSGLNAVVIRTFDEARARAREADAALSRGEVWGPLHGVPITLKETWWLKGSRANAGNLKFKDFVASSDAPAVTSLLNAGAIVLGKTNVPYMTADWQSYNVIYGTSSNPYRLDRTCGGSSGGSAAAVAAGFAALELGSDIAGSIRIPAHFCGVCGHKPTQGIVCFAGHAPSSNHPLIEKTPKPARNRFDPTFKHDLHVAGPIARTCEDLELAMRLLAGPEPHQASNGWSFTLPPAGVSHPAELKVACWLDDEYCRVDSEMLALLTAAAQKLASFGAEVNFEARPAKDASAFFQESHEAYSATLSAALGLPQGGKLTYKEFERTKLTRQRCKEAWSRFFEEGEWDVLLCPVAMTTAFAHDHTEDGTIAPCSDPFHSRFLTVNGQTRPYAQTNRWAGLTTFTDLPCTVVPVGMTKEGLPCGIQIVGPMYQDLRTIEVGKMMERLGCRFRPPNVEATVGKSASKL